MHNVISARVAALLLGALIATSGFGAGARSAHAIDVGNVAELNKALAAANPGDTIHLKDGTYTGVATITRSGADGKPITLSGSANAILTNPGKYALYLNGAAYWIVKGVTVKVGMKGIMLDASKHVIIDGVTITEIDGEALHLRKSTQSCVVQNSKIFNTGQKSPGMGEAIYIGSAMGNWAKIMGDAKTPDQSDNNKILNNVLGPNVDSELIDIKEGTSGGLISGNVLDGTGMSGENSADSWVDVKGNNYRIEKNRGVHTPLDGFSVHGQLDKWGCGNIFSANDATITAPTGVAINVPNKDVCKTTVHRDNKSTGGAGLVNPGQPLT